MLILLLSMLCLVLTHFQKYGVKYKNLIYFDSQCFAYNEVKPRVFNFRLMGNFFDDIFTFYYSEPMYKK